jgi:CTP:molybdopterin cytidylyltransferase MocA
LSNLPVAVLLAAGEGRRYGSIKQLALIDGEAMVRRSARAVLGSGLAVIVVTGAHAPQVEAAIADLPLRIVRNHAWQEGMGYSLALGIRQLQEDHPAASGALLCLADQPLMDAGRLKAMVDRHRLAQERIVATDNHGTAGPPALFPRDCFDALRNWSGPQGAQALLKREAARVDLFAPFAGIDVDTPEDLRQVLAMIGANDDGGTATA